MGGPTSGNKNGGPGRKPLPDGKKKESLTIWIKPDLKQWLKSQPGGAGPTVERLVERYINHQKMADKENQYRQNRYANNGKPWKQEEIDLIIKSLAGKRDNEYWQEVKNLSVKLKRKLDAVRQKIGHLKRFTSIEALEREQKK